MIALKKGIEKKMGQYYSTKLVEIEEEYSKKESSEQEADEQKKTKEAVRVLRGFPPEEIRKYQQELRQRIALYEKKVALLDRKEKEIEDFKADVENRKKRNNDYEGKAWGETLMLISKERINLDRDLIVFDENERKNMKRFS